MNEQLKRLVSIWKLLATQTRLSEYVEPQDIEVFERRALGEGLTFLTVVLPRLFKALDRACAESTLGTVTGFKLCKNKAYPQFLRKAWAAIFLEDGTLRSTEEIPADAVACVRQLSAVFYKLELPYTESQEDAVFLSFVEAEVDVHLLDLTPARKSGLLSRARRILCRLLAGVNPLDIRPRHGSGASACGIVSHERYESFRFIPRLNEVFPYDSFFFYSNAHLADQLSALLDAEEDEPKARAVLVPKDSRGPRLISCEPREFMFIQQGLMRLLYDTVQSYPAIRGQIGFTDQTRNQVLAKLGSMDQSYATLDLKEASDRVSLELVKELFPENWYNALAASRSLGTMLPNETYVPFAKFAPMGSACCFPVEALCFWSIALAAVGDELYVQRIFNNSLLHEAGDSMSVFGDDIIVPTRHASRVMDALETCGLIVNRDKSYWNGPFRESCGGDYFNGVDVTPVRVKKMPLVTERYSLGKRPDNEQYWHRTADLMNNLIWKYGYSYVGLQCHSLIEQWYGPTPVSNQYRLGPYGIEKLHAGLSVYGLYTDVPSIYASRLNSNLQRKEYRLRTELSVDLRVDADRWGQVMRRELQMLRPFTADRCSLAKRTRYKYSWTAL